MPYFYLQQGIGHVFTSFLKIAVLVKTNNLSYICWKGIVVYRVAKLKVLILSHLQERSFEVFFLKQTWIFYAYATFIVQEKLNGAYNTKLFKINLTIRNLYLWQINWQKKYRSLKYASIFNQNFLILTRTLLCHRLWPTFIAGSKPTLKNSICVVSFDTLTM